MTKAEAAALFAASGAPLVPAHDVACAGPAVLTAKAWFDTLK